MIEQDELSSDLRYRLGEGAFSRTGTRSLEVWSGGNAHVFPFANAAGGPSKVLRFPKLGVMDATMRSRYQILASYISRQPAHLGLPGITVVDSCFESWHSIPGLVIDDTDAVELDVFVDTHHKSAGLLRTLANTFLNRVSRFQQDSFAHGDLTHENIMVGLDGDTVRLAFVDFDGYFLKNAPPPAVVGHPFYRHPGYRDEDWGPWMDSFPALVIWIALRAIAADPEIYEEATGDGEGSLLFEDQDLRKPGATDVWRTLESSPDPTVRAGSATLRALLSEHRPPARSIDLLRPRFDA